MQRSTPNSEMIAMGTIKSSNIATKTMTHAEQLPMQSGWYVSRGLACTILFFYLAVLVSAGLILTLLGLRVDVTAADLNEHVPCNDTKFSRATTTSSMPSTTSIILPTTHSPNVSISTTKSQDSEIVRICTTIKRTPTWLMPYQYDLFVYDISSTNYSANVKIELRIDAAGTTQRTLIPFHVHKLSVSIASLFRVDESTQRPIHVPTQMLRCDEELGLEDSFLVMRSIGGNSFPAGIYQAKIQFIAPIDSVRSEGVFVKQLDESDREKTIVATNFKPIYARKAFPCFDEPGFKANFNFRVEHPKKTQVLSNFPGQEPTSIVGDLLLTSFNSELIQLSMHSLSWVIIPKDEFITKSDTAGDLTIRVYYRRSLNAGASLDVFLNNTKKFLATYQAEFVTSAEYKMSKLDIVCVPDIDNWSAVHWGLILMPESEIVFVDADSSALERQRMALALSKQLATLWFGNSISIKWWDDYWFMESMAAYLSYLVVDKLFPEFVIMEQFLLDITVPSMWRDTLSSALPVKVTNLNTNERIVELVEVGGFGKATAIVAMAASIVDPDEFIKRTQSFVKSYEGQAVTASNFFPFLNMNDVIKDMNAFVESWVSAPNYPEVKISLDRNTKGKSFVRFQQSEFVFPPRPVNFNKKSLWKIYLRCRVGDAELPNEPNDDTNDDDESTPPQSQQPEDTDFVFYLQEETGQYDLNAAYSWVKCNRHFNGFYLSDYTTDLSLNLSSLLNRPINSMSVYDRANLLNDAFTLSFFTNRSYANANSLMTYLKGEYTDNTTNIPWGVVNWHLRTIADLKQYRSLFAFQTYMDNFLATLSTKMDIWAAQGTHQAKLLAAETVNLLCGIQDAKCLEKASEQFRKPTQLHDLYPHILKYHLQNTYEFEDWNKVRGMYPVQEDPRKNGDILTALSASRTGWILKDFFESFSDTDTVFFTVLISVGRNPNGRHLVWDYIKKNWQELLVDKINVKPYVAAFIQVTASFETQTLLNEVNTFWTSTKLPFSEWERKHVRAIIDANIRWIAENEHDFNTKFLSSKTTL